MFLTPDAEGTGVRASIAWSSGSLDRSRPEKLAEGPDDLDGPDLNMRQTSAKEGGGPFANHQGSCNMKIVIRMMSGVRVCKLAFSLS
jgi:hypothetical protein